jgi:Flp pilus assembly protein TadG
MIGGTLNLGNYNNVKMEVTATSAEAARAAFQQEISTTVGMMKGIINQVGV